MRVSVGEGASLDILSGNSNVEAILDEGRESKRLSSSPIDIFSRVDAVGSRLKDLLDKSVEVVGGWQDGNFLPKVLQSVDGDAREFVFLDIVFLDGLPLFGHPVLSLVLEGLALDVGLFEMTIDHRFHLSETILVHDTAGEQLLLILTGHRGHLCDLFVHEWLRETWLIELVMAHLSIADNVNNNVVLELLSVLSSGSEHEIDIVQAVCVDMEDWGAHRLGQV
jgi:hypothetical protein